MKTKKHIIVLLVACILFSFVFCGQLSSCGSASDEYSDPELLPAKELISPRESEFYLFDGYEELLSWAFNGEDENKSNQDFGQDYIDYMRELNSDSENAAHLYIPYYEGNPAPLWSYHPGYNITLFTSELYYLPWVFYDLNINGQTLSVRCACLSQKDVARVNVSKASTAVKNFSRTGPNVDNSKHVSEKTIEFAGESISAIYINTKDNELDYLQFAYGQTMVLIYASPDVLNGDVIASISLRRAEAP